MGDERQSSARPSSRGRPPVVVVGAGAGGLACAVDLASRGIDVLILERHASPGGKVRQVAVAGRMLDAGPTVFTMRWVFEELFAQAGARLDALLTLQPLPTLARHAWSADERLDLFADVDRSAAAIADFAGDRDAACYRRFCAAAADVYRTLEAPFLRGSRPTPLSLAARVGWRQRAGLWRIAPFASLWSRLGREFADPRLRQLFGRYATYCGSSPFAAPATLMLVAHVEQQGVWAVEGGMHRVAMALTGLAERHGATVRCGCHVREIVVRDGRAVGVQVESADGEAEFVAADAVVFNGDVAALGDGLLGAAAASRSPRIDPARRSLSAITWNLVARPRGFPMLRHNVFFGADYRDEFDAVFRRSRVSDDPTVYVCAQDREGRRGGGSTPPTDTSPERLLCLVNAPPRGDAAPPDAQEIARCRERMTTVLARCGMTIDDETPDTVTTTPLDFARLFPGSGGALYGQASHGWAASFRRPGARSSISRLYLAGGTVHPGPGLPMAVLSGRQAAASVLHDQTTGRRSIARSPAPATPGGTSTH